MPDLRLSFLHLNPLQLNLPYLAQLITPGVHVCLAFNCDCSLTFN